MKKLIAIIMACLTAVACCFALTACGSKNVKGYAEYELTSESYAFLIKKGNSELVDSVNGVLDEIKASGELDSIINSFFNGEATFTYTNPVGEIPTDHSQYFIVATNAYFPPFEYYDGDKLTGVDMQIASIIAQKLNKTLYESKVPMNRGCFPKDVAKAIIYCVEQKYETGQAIPVTGGQVMLN